MYIYLYTYSCVYIYVYICIYVYTSIDIIHNHKFIFMSNAMDIVDTTALAGEFADMYVYMCIHIYI